MLKVSTEAGPQRKEALTSAAQGSKLFPLFSLEMPSSVWHCENDAEAVLGDIPLVVATLFGTVIGQSTGTISNCIEARTDKAGS